MLIFSLTSLQNCCFQFIMLLTAYRLHKQLCRRYINSFIIYIIQIHTLCSRGLILDLNLVYWYILDTIFDGIIDAFEYFVCSISCENNYIRKNTAVRWILFKSDISVRKNELYDSCRALVYYNCTAWMEDWKCNKWEAGLFAQGQFAQKLKKRNPAYTNLN